MEQIKNDSLSLSISEHGAELQSIKDINGKEYLWDGDPEYWPRQSFFLSFADCGKIPTDMAEKPTKWSGTALPETPILNW